MWLYLAFASALLLGGYDVAKKIALKKNGVMWVLFSISALSTLILVPWFKAADAPGEYMLLVPKAFLVTISWISGLYGMKYLPLTTVSIIKASRPAFVIVLSILLFAERLSPLQWCAVALVLASLLLLGRSSRDTGNASASVRGWLCMGLSVLSGVASALYDKYAVTQMDPVFVLCWSNLFIAVLMGLVLAFQSLREGEGRQRFKADPMLLVAAVVIVGADALYFIALSQEGSMLSIISLVRRFSILVTFAISALIFKEKNLRSKALPLLLMILSMLCLCLVK